VKIGELFLFGYGPDSAGFLLDFARQHGLGGIILFQHNFDAIESLAKQLEAFKQAAGSNLIVCVDQEGGEVVRTETHTPVFPSPRHYVRANDPEGLRISARITAGYLRQMGINLNLAPVCDVLTNPRNSLMLKRCFGEDSGTVSEYVGVLIEEYHRHKIGCCAKHFPGLGSSEIDPHKKLAITDISREDFETTDWPPFKQAVESEVEMVMTTHLLAKSLDPEYMATFSRIIATDYLRGRLGFEGVLVTDDLGMGAVTSDYSPAERAVNALRAGHDMLMFCHDRKDQDSAFKSVLDLYNNGELDRDEIAMKISRIHKLKEKLER
jgi:beta-N-acetylhexosaminidase